MLSVHIIVLTIRTEEKKSKQQMYLQNNYYAKMIYTAARKCTEKIKLKCRIGTGKYGCVQKKSLNECHLNAFV